MGLRAATIPPNRRCPAEGVLSLRELAEAAQKRVYVNGDRTCRRQLGAVPGSRHTAQIDKALLLRRLKFPRTHVPIDQLGKARSGPYFVCSTITRQCR